MPDAIHDIGGIKVSQPRAPHNPPRMRKTFPTAFAPLKRIGSVSGFSINQTECSNCSWVKPQVLVNSVLGTFIQPAGTMPASFLAVR